MILEKIELDEFDLKLIKEAENFAQQMYWFLCKHGENETAAYAQALCLRLARLRGYEGD